MLSKQTHLRTACVNAFLFHKLWQLPSTYKNTLQRCAIKVVALPTWPLRFHIGEHLWLLSSKLSHVTLSVERLLSLPEDWTLDKLPFSLVLFSPLARKDLVSVDREEMDEVLFGTSGGTFWPWHHGRCGGVPDFGVQLSCLLQDAWFWWSGDVAMVWRSDESRFKAVSCPN